MKKITALFLSLSIIVLSGCFERISDVKAETSEISFIAEFDEKETETEYFIEIQNNKTIVTVLKPENIKSTAYIFEEDKAAVDFMGLKEDLAIYESNEDFVPAFIYKSFLQAGKEKKSKIENNSVFISGFADEIPFKLYFGNTGLPIKLENEKNGKEIIIKNATIIK